MQHFRMRKANFSLCWMDIDVQQLRFQLDANNKLRMFPFWQKGLVPFIDRMGNGGIFNRAPVDKNFLRGARGFGMMGADREPGELEGAWCVSEGEEVIEECRPIYLE